MILVPGPPPSSSISSGSSATAGSGRRNSTTVSIAVRAGRTLPSSSPSGIAISAANPTAIRNVSTVATLSSRKSVSPASSSAARGSTVDGGGR